MSAKQPQILGDKWASTRPLIGGGNGSGFFFLLSNLTGPGWVIAFAAGLMASGAGVFCAVTDMAEALRFLVLVLSSIFGFLGVSYFFVRLPTGKRIRARAHVAGICAAVEGLAQPYVITDAVGAITWTNLAGAPLLRSADGNDVIAPKLTGAGTDTVEGLSRKCIEDAAAQGLLVFDSAEGSTRHCAVSLILLARDPAALLWEVRDITELADLRARSHAATRDLAGYLDAGGIGFFVAGPAGRFKFLNRTLARWIGSDDPDSFVSQGVGFSDVFDQGERDGDGVPFRSMRLRGASGDTISVRVTSQVSGLSGTDTRETYALVHDMSKEERFQDALGVATGRIERFLNDAPLSIALVHRSGSITGVNDRFKTLFGDESQDHQGRLFTDLVHEADRHHVQDYLEQVLDDHSKTKRIALRLGQAGSTTAMLYASRVSEDDQTPGLVLYLVDTTD